MSEMRNNQQPEVYEFLDPGGRFVSLAREVMRQHHQDPDAELDDGEISISWPDNASSDHYKIAKDYVQNGRGTVLMAYVLEHFTADYSATKPFKRYFVAADEEGDTTTTSRIHLIDHKNLPMTHEGPSVFEWQRNIARTALRTLTAQAPELANHLLTAQLDERFNTAIGDYILSEYAIDTHSRELTDDTIKQSMRKFHKRIQRVKESVLEDSKVHGPNGGDPHPAYTEAVSEAVRTQRKPDGKNRYRVIEYGEEVLDAAKDIKQWTNLITKRDPYRSRGPQEA